MINAIFRVYRRNKMVKQVTLALPNLAIALPKEDISRQFASDVLEKAKMSGPYRVKLDCYL